MKKILIKQTNTKIMKDVLFDIREFKKEPNAKYVLFHYDETIKRNRYDVKCIKKTKLDTLDSLTEESYRGEIKIEGYGVLPLFVIGFDFPLYSMELCYQHTSESNQWYSIIRSPLTFKLKNKEDRLCYDILVYEFSDLTDLANDRWNSKKHIKAKKIEIPTVVN